MAMQANEAVEGKVVAEPATNLKAATATTNLKPATATKLEESLNHLFELMAESHSSQEEDRRRIYEQGREDERLALAEERRKLLREKHNLKVLKDLVFRKCEEMIVLSAATARSKWRAEIVRALREMMVDEASAETPSEIGCGHEHEQEDERESEREHEPEHEGDHEGDHEQEDEREGEREREHECERDHEQEDEHVRVEHDEHEHEHKYKCAVGRPPPILIGTNTTSTRKWAQPPPTPRGCLGRGA